MSALYLGLPGRCISRLMEPSIELWCDVETFRVTAAARERCLESD
jgi:hypothetical protein